MVSDLRDTLGCSEDGHEHGHQHGHHQREGGSLDSPSTHRDRHTPCAANSICPER